MVLASVLTLSGNADTNVGAVPLEPVLVAG